MKKLLLASLITATSFGASANSIINFDDSSFTGVAGTSVEFDRVLFAADEASVTQQDADGNGTVFGPAEPFDEFGTATAVVFQLGQTVFNPVGNNGGDAYQVFYDYSFSGSAVYNGAANEIDVTFDSGMSGLYVDKNLDAGLDVGAVQVATLSAIPGGVCDLNLDSTGSGRCEINLVVDFMAGYFFNASGEDLSTLTSTSLANLIVTIDEVSGFSTDYAGETEQNFTVVHNGNMTFDVPEPASVAILGLGLLGFAGARRRKA